jgi:hypothetical protein
LGGGERGDERWETGKVNGIGDWEGEDGPRAAVRCPEETEFFNYFKKIYDGYKILHL